LLDEPGKLSVLLDSFPLARPWEEAAESSRSFIFVSSEPPSPSQPRSRLYRRILFSATLTPLLFTSGLICLAAGHSSWGIAVLVLMAILAIRTPYTPTAAGVVDYLPMDIVRWDSTVKAIFIALVISAAGKDPETHAYLEHLTSGRLLTSGPLIFAAVFTGLAIYRNHRYLRGLSNEQIETYHCGNGPVRFSNGIFTLYRDPVAASKGKEAPTK